MSDEATPAVETAAPVDAPETETESSAPAVDASAAGKALAARRAEIRERLKAAGRDKKEEKDGQPGPKGESANSAATATNAGAKDASVPKEKDEKKDAPTTKQEARADAAKDKKDEDLSAMIREDRRIKAEAKKLAEEKAAIEATKKEIAEIAPRIKAARELLAKGDKVGAVKAALPELDDSDLFWEYAKRMGDAGEGAANPAQVVDPDKLAAEIEARLEAKHRALAEEAEKKKEAERQAELKELEDARTEYLGAVNDVFQANSNNYSGVTRLFKLIGTRANAVVSERIIELAEEHGRKTGNVLSVSDALAKVNAELLADQAREDAANDNHRPAATVTNAWRSDPGRPAAAPANKTLEEIRAERKAAIRSQAAAR